MTRLTDEELATLGFAADAAHANSPEWMQPAQGEWTRNRALINAAYLALVKPTTVLAMLAEIRESRAVLAELWRLRGQVTTVSLAANLPDTVRLDLQRIDVEMHDQLLAAARTADPAPRLIRQLEAARAEAERKEAKRKGGGR